MQDSDDWWSMGLFISSLCHEPTSRWVFSSSDKIVQYSIWVLGSLHIHSSNPAKGLLPPMIQSVGACLSGCFLEDVGDIGSVWSKAKHSVSRVAFLNSDGGFSRNPIQSNPIQSKGRRPRRLPLRLGFVSFRRREVLYSFSVRKPMYSSRLVVHVWSIVLHGRPVQNCTLNSEPEKYVEN